MHQGSMAGQPSRAIATKGVSDDGAAEWTITFEDGSVEKYPEVDTADNPQSFPNLFSNLGSGRSGILGFDRSIRRHDGARNAQPRTRRSSIGKAD
jgi:hypothetical protein